MESGFRVTTARWVGVVMAGAAVIVAACPVGEGSGDGKNCEEVVTAQIACDPTLNKDKAFAACQALTCDDEQDAWACIINLSCGGDPSTYETQVKNCLKDSKCTTEEPESDGGPDAGPDGGSCQSAPESNTCATQFPDYPLYCGGTACCPQDLPYGCNESGYCYETQAAAEQDCGSSCVACSSGGPSGSCQAAPTTNRCTDADHGAQCQSGCCPLETPFACVASDGTGDCYATAEQAQAACGDSCEACNTSGGPGGGGSCQAAPTTNTCQDADHPHQCNSGCCVQGSPFLCPGLGCAATQEEAEAACPGACEACTP